MRAFDAVKEAARREGKSLKQISREMGVSPSTISTGSSRGSVPRCDTMARMLSKVGWSLVAMPYEDVPEGAIRIEQ